MYINVEIITHNCVYAVFRCVDTLYTVGLRSHIQAS